MRKFNKPFDISKSVIPVSDLKLVDPGTAVYNEEYLTLSNYSIKRMASLLNMGSGQFTKKLFALEPSIWMNFLHQRLGLKDIQEILSHNNAIVVEDTIVTISEGDSYVEDVVSSINDYIEDEDLDTSYLLYEKEILIVIAVNGEGNGALIKYYYQDNWITIHDCYYNSKDRSLIVSPYKELDTKVDEEISMLMDESTIISTCTSTMPYQLSSYLNKMAETYMSVDELVHYMKKVFKLRMTIDPIDVYSFAADNEDISAKSISQLEGILNKFYSDCNAPLLINSSYLKKATYLTKVSYADFSKLLETMFLEENSRVHIQDLINFQSKVLNKDTNYDALRS